MRRKIIPIYVLLCITGCLFSAAPLVAQQAPESTTWFIVRHADRAGEDDALTEAGEQRAQQLADLMKTLRVDAVYSTDTKRTKRTARPTAKALNLSVVIYGQLTKEWFERIKSKHRGQVVLIVGHSNTAGRIVNGLGGEGDFSMSDDEYENLFVVSTGEGTSKVVRLKFGERTKSN